MMIFTTVTELLGRLFRKKSDKNIEIEKRLCVFFQMFSPPPSPVTVEIPIHIPNPYQVKATCDYYATRSSELTFYKDQVFYVLVENNGEYLVSTSKTSPFSISNRNGFVPKSLFTLVTQLSPPKKQVYKVLRNRTVYIQ